MGDEWFKKDKIFEKSPRYMVALPNQFLTHNE